MGLQNGYGQTDIYSFKVRSAEGDSLSLESYKGRNFTKFLVSRDGKVVARFEPTATAQDMEPLLKEELMKAVR